MKKWIALAALMLVAFAYAGQYSAAQTSTLPAPTARATVARSTAVPQATWTAGPSSTVQINFVACANQAVVNLTGLLTSGRAIYYQVFNAAGGGGTALTGLRQVNGSGSYAVSEVVPYANDQTVAGGAVASVAVRIASSSNANSIEFQTTVDDGQDGCNNPQNPATTSTDLGGAGGATSGSSGSSSAPPAGQIRAPGGIILNENLQPEAQVVVGSRTSLTYRSTTAGLVFAECDKYPQALPGVIYNTDKVTIFWSWYAKTLQQVYDQRVHAQFSVKVNTAPLRNADVSEPAQIDGNYWIFYTVPLGNLRPGHYEVEFRQTWDAVITDGFTKFGPNTANDLTASNCNFDVTDLKSKDPVVYAEQYNPTNYAVHDLDAAIDAGSQGG